ncbi:MAG: hypothetical protein K2X90_01320 [Candidatus Babeliaceae bacterium]|nr:hypothetical protein [Candidatus Babeliaceae bacterium]
MKKKNIVIISSMVNMCFAQPRQAAPLVHNNFVQSTIEIEQHQAENSEKKKSCAFTEDALSDFDFLLDFEDEQNCTTTENSEESNAILSCLQRFVNALGIKAVLGILYLSDICFDAQSYLQGLFHEKK